jgi:hypothetical protein
MNHIQSPDTSDSAIEREIVAKGLTAPRITPNQIENNIASEYYFTARQGVDGADIEQLRASEPTAPLQLAAFSDDTDLHKTSIAPLNLLTFCVLVLRNGFTVTGESACASPENFDAEVGRKIARANAVNKIWPLMGYELKQRLSEQG